MDSTKTTDEKKNLPRNELILNAADFPLKIDYGGKRYVLILTKNDKLILQKAVE